MEHQISTRIHERRRKRLIIPIIYFIFEIIFFWLVLSLIQMQFTFESWNQWALVIFIAAVAYSLFKTIHIYKRQKNYTRESEITKLFS